MNCQNCGAPMTLLLEKRQFSCEYCKSIYFPEKNADGIQVIDESSEYQCPISKVNLNYAYIDDIPLFYCPHCQGLLIDQFVFRVAVDFLRSHSSQPPIQPPPFDSRELKRSITCPRCGQEMTTHPYGGPGNIVIDNCPICHLVWMDYGEIRRVIRTPGRDNKHSDWD
jgi:Zn-finger nucleic acid-binding protein